jgi:hypothetical protein
MNQVRNLGGNILNEELNLKTILDLAKMSLSDYNTARNNARF